MIPLSPYTDFKTASEAVLDYLYSRLGFGLWMVTRSESNDWIVLSSADHGYGVNDGDVFRWTDSFCSRMVEGKGPRIAPKSNDVPAYASAPIGSQVDIGAYIGVPLTRTNGDLFGTLCAIDPKPMPDNITAELPLIEVMAKLLTTILENELKAQEEHRKAERALAQAKTDQLTGLYNRRGWEQLLIVENERCNRYGHPVGILSIDLDELKRVNDELGHVHGDKLLRLTAEILNRVTRLSDVVARLGGDEFAVLAVENDLVGMRNLTFRLKQAFDSAGVSASIGMSMRPANGDFGQAFEEADQLMYQDKRQRKTDRAANTCDLPG